MEADRREAEIKEPIRDMDRGSDEMEHHIDELGDDIEQAKRTAQQRQDRPSETDAPLAGTVTDDDDAEDDGRSDAEGEGEDADDDRSAEAQAEIDRGVDRRGGDDAAPASEAR